MTRPELIAECSKRFGKRAWLGATNAELEACLAGDPIPDAWASGRLSATAGNYAGDASNLPADGTEADSGTDKPASNLPARESTAAPVGTSNLPARKPSGPDSLADAIASALQGRISAGIDEGQVETIARKVFADMGFMTPRPVEVRLPDREACNVGLQHSQFPEVLQTLTACGQAWLVGPAGSGKTYMAEACAKALNLPFYFNGAIDSAYKLSGFIDAQGRIIRPAFRQAYENGGVYLFDEVDASMPGAVLAFNAAMSNGKYDFPDGTVERHADFYCLAAANTYGLGATDDYVGRCKQDAAFLDRFPAIYLDYDEALEHAIAGNGAWVSYVQTCRKAARNRGLKLVISPRASIFGSRLLASGMDRRRVADLTIRKGMSDEHWRTISGDDEALSAWQRVETLPQTGKGEAA